MKNFNIGCVLFIDENEGINGVGYSSSTGFIKVDSFKDLDKKSFWITNIKSNITEDTKNIKNTFFLGIKLDSLIYQMGLSNIQRKIVAKEISIISKNIIFMLHENYKIKINKNTLTESLIDSLNLKQNKTKDDPFIKKIVGKTSNFEITNVQKTKDEMQSYLFYPRYEYNRNLCKISTPKGSWKTIDNKLYRNKDKYWFSNISNKYHFLALVKLTNINKDLKYLLPENTKNSKVWINEIQYNLLVKFSNIFVEKLHICSSRMYLKDIENKKLFKLHSFEKGSISNGICSSNYVKSFIENDDESLLSSWIKTYDRYKMLEVAIIFSKFNIKVNSYGSGGILISFDDTDKNKELILKVCKKLNLFYPMVVFS